jgi:hypothetical protein
MVLQWCYSGITEVLQVPILALLIFRLCEHSVSKAINKIWKMLLLSDVVILSIFVFFIKARL